VILITSALPRMPSLPVVRGEIKRAALEARVVQFVTNEWNHTAYVMGRPQQLTDFWVCLPTLAGHSGSPRKVEEVTVRASRRFVPMWRWEFLWRRVTSSNHRWLAARHTTRRPTTCCQDVMRIIRHRLSAAGMKQDLFRLPEFSVCSFVTNTIHTPDHHHGAAERADGW
jgi:hypothetical protein